MSKLNLRSIRETSERLNLCEKSVWNHTAPRGTLPCVRIGSRLLFREEDIDAWIESRAVRPDPESAKCDDPESAVEDANHA